MSKSFQDFLLQIRQGNNKLLNHDLIKYNRDIECLMNYLKTFRSSNDIHNIVSRIKDEIEQNEDKNEDKYKKHVLEKCRLIMILDRVTF